MKKFTKIFEPLTINKVTLKNRLVVSAMVTGYVNTDGTLTERFMRYHEEKAKGGWGLIITEDYAVSADAGASARIPGLYRADFVAENKLFTARIHAAGGTIFAQIYHAGRATSSKVTGVQPIAPSAIRDVTKSEMPRALTIPEIHELIEKFAQSALYAKLSGFDGVEIHGASGYLISQFMSPYSNKRTDQYGGNTVNRARFAVEIIKRVRELVGPDYPISYRLACVEYVEGGLEIEEAKVIAQILEAAGVDMIHCTQGIFASRPVITPAYPIAPARFVHNAAEIKQVVSLPVIAVGRINTPNLAEEILSSGQADLVTMARASLADPGLPNKVLNAQINDIQLCIGCVQGCQGGLASGNGVRCLVNPLTGREGEFFLKPAHPPQKVFIAGGGISGCEAAIIAAVRGHQVTLYEKSSQLGGQWQLACVPLGKADFASFLNWQVEQLNKLKVKIVLNTPVTAALLTTENPDILFDATGSQPFIPPIKGIEQKNVFTAAQILSGEVTFGKRVVVIGGGLVGSETAEFMAAYHTQVFMIEALAEIAKDAVSNPRLLLLESLKKKGVVCYTKAQVTEIDGMTIKFNHNSKIISLDDIDTFVNATGMRAHPLDAAVLDNFSGRVLVIGDASNAKDGYSNIQESFDAARLL